MSIRETLNRYPAATSGVVVVVILLAVAISFVYQTRAGKAPNAYSAYYTTDDGQTTFVDDFFKAYPFDHDGKPAYRAYVFQTSSGKRFVGYLERYTNEGVAELKPMLEDRSNLESVRHQIQTVRDRDAEVKKADDPNARWVRVGSAQADRIIQAPFSSQGPNSSVVLVFP